MNRPRWISWKIQTSSRRWHVNFQRFTASALPPKPKTCLKTPGGKRIRKLARMIVANNARSAIGCDMNEAVIVTADKEVATGLVRKDVLAQTIIECIADDLAKEV